MVLVFDALGMKWATIGVFQVRNFLVVFLKFLSESFMFVGNVRFG